MLKDKLFKETFWGLMAQGIAFVFFILINIVLARSLGAEGFGLWSFFFSIISVLIMLSYFGIDESAKKYVAQYNKTTKVSGIIKDSFKLRFLFSFIIAGLLFVFSKQLSVLAGFTEFEVLFQYASPLVFFMGFVGYFKNLFMGFHRIVYNFIINLLEFGLKLAFILVLFYFSINLLNIVIAFNLAAFFTSIVGLLILYFVFYRKAGYHPNNSFTLDIFKYSIPLFLGGVAFLIATELDTIMLGLLSTTMEVGIYAVAKQIIIKITHISFAIAIGTMPIFAKLNEKNKVKLKKSFFKLLKINTLMMSVIIIFILLFSGFFVPLLFGFEYSASVFPLQILTIFLFIFSTAVFLAPFLDYVGLAKKKAIYLALSVVLNIVLNFVLIPNFGAAGAAFATSVSYIPYIILNWLEVKKVFSIKNFNHA